MKKIISVFVSLSIILSMFSFAYAEEEAQAEPAEALPPSISLDGLEEPKEYEYNYELVAETSAARLYLDKSINSFRVETKADGKYYDTKVMNGQVGNSYVQAEQKSDFILDVKGMPTSINNFEQSIELDQVTYQQINNGIRATFIVGEKNAVNIFMFPKYISEERLNELIYPNLTKAEIKSFEKDFYSKTTEKYISRNERYNADGTKRNVPIMRLKKLYEFFYERSGYTLEELNADNAEWGEPEYFPPVTMTIIIDYTLDGSDLVVNIPLSEMIFDELNPVNNITLMPYLLSGSLFEDGYIFVPDGSGAIMNFNTGNVNAPKLEIPIYGRDMLYSTFDFKESTEQATLPVMGIKKGSDAILGIIEKGAEIATVTANSSGKVDEFNKVQVSFNTNYMEKIPLLLGFGQTSTIYQKKPYLGDITMRYVYLHGDKANYTGMAKAYKDYLQKRGMIKSNPVAEQAPLFVEMLATIVEWKLFLGFSYSSNKPLTTFSQAQSILETLKASGINNIKFQYDDWFNKGALNYNISNIDVLGNIGGKKGLQSMINYTYANNIDFYPSVRTNLLTNSKGFSANRDFSRRINDAVAYYPMFNAATHNVISAVNMLSPKKIPGMVNKFVKSSDKLGLNSVTMMDTGTLLYGDYNTKNQIMRYDATQYFVDALDSMANGGKSMMFSNANSYAFPYASAVTDLPSTGSGYRSIDYSVPFVQMVLENDVPYSLPAGNNKGNFDPDRYLLQAIESKSALKYMFTYEDESAFSLQIDQWGSQYTPQFTTHFARYESSVSEYYKKYNEFYQKVKNSEIVLHERINKNIVKVAYENGVQIYLNYGKSPAIVDGVKIPSASYVYN